MPTLSDLITGGPSASGGAPPSEAEMMQDLQTADAAGDTQLAQHIAGQIKAARSGAITGMADLGSAGNAVQAGVLNFVHQLPLVGDVAMTAARGARDAAAGEGFDWGRANNEVHTILSSAQQTHPIASFVGGAAGALDTGVLGGAALKAAGIGVPSALALRAGQPMLNTARLAATGALVGGAQGAAQAAGEQAAAGNVDQIIPAAVAGGGTGAAVGAVTGAAGVPAMGLVKRFMPLSAKAGLALSKVFGEDPSDLQAIWQQFINETGRAPSMAELADFKQQAIIKGFAKDSTTISDALNQRAAEAAQERSANMQARFTINDQGNPIAASPTDFANARTAQGDVDYPAARQFNFSIPTTESAELGGVSPADHIAAEILPQAGLGKADRVRILAGLQNGELSGQDAQMIRSGLSESLSRNYSPAVKGFLSDFESIIGGPGNEQANAALGNATSNFAANSQRVEGAQHGASILGNATPNEFSATAAAKPNDNPDFKVGMQAGANDKLAATAGTPSGATSLAQRFATDDSLHSKLATTFGSDTADALRRMGIVETGSARALAPYAGSPAPETDGDLKADATQVMAAVASHGIGWKLFHLSKLAIGVDMPQSVQTKVAQYLADPKMAAQGISLLKKAGITDSALRRLTMSAAAAAGGLTGGNAVTITDVHPATAAEIAAATGQ